MDHWPAMWVSHGWRWWQWKSPQWADNGFLEMVYIQAVYEITSSHCHHIQANIIRVRATNVPKNQHHPPYFICVRTRFVRGFPAIIQTDLIMIFTPTSGVSGFFICTVHRNFAPAPSNPKLPQHTDVPFISCPTNETIPLPEFTAFIRKLYEQFKTWGFAVNLPKWWMRMAAPVNDSSGQSRIKGKWEVKIILFRWKCDDIFCMFRFTDRFIASKQVHSSTAPFHHPTGIAVYPRWTAPGACIFYKKKLVACHVPPPASSANNMEKVLQTECPNRRNQFCDCQ